jgi:type III restriction enzyme
LSKTRPAVVNPGPYLTPKKSIFTKIVPDQGFERDFARFLDGCPDIVSFAKNTQATGFRIEYRNAEGGIANYVPDFLVKETPTDVWIVETKGREDLDDPPKWERLRQWCDDATAQDDGRRYRAMFVREEEWEQYPPHSFDDLRRTFGAPRR